MNEVKILLLLYRDGVLTLGLFLTFTIAETMLERLGDLSFSDEFWRPWTCGD